MGATTDLLHQGQESITGILSVGIGMVVFGLDLVTVHGFAQAPVMVTGVFLAFMCPALALSLITLVTAWSPLSQ